MSDKAIIFSGPMVRALLDGRKTQTRRVLTKQPEGFGPFHIEHFAGTDTFDIHERPRFVRGKFIGSDRMQIVRTPYAPGDRLYVREAHSLHNAFGQHREDSQRWGPWSGLPTRVSPYGTQIAYFREGFDRCDPGRWRPSIHMPRWASRLTLTVTEVRVQRLQEISEEDARAEGCDVHEEARPLGDFAANLLGRRASFIDLWNSLHGPDAWAANPWVAAYTFTVARRNIDEAQT